jgi:hypothetical protein
MKASVAANAELERLVMMGKFGPIDSIAEKLSEIVLVLRTRVLAISLRVASRVMEIGPGEVHKLVQSEVHGALEELSKTVIPSDRQRPR